MLVPIEVLWGCADAGYPSSAGFFNVLQPLFSPSAKLLRSDHQREMFLANRTFTSNSSNANLPRTPLNALERAHRCFGVQSLFFLGIFLSYVRKWVSRGGGTIPISLISSSLFGLPSFFFCSYLESTSEPRVRRSDSPPLFSFRPPPLYFQSEAIFCRRGFASFLLNVRRPPALR